MYKFVEPCSTQTMNMEHKSFAFILSTSCGKTDTQKKWSHLLQIFNTDEQKTL